MVQVITAEGAARAALAAHAEGRLGFQRGHEMCQYEYEDGGCCAIGAVLTPETLKLVHENHENGCSVNTLLEQDLISVPGDDLFKLSKLQEFHDEACDSRSLYEKMFLEYARELAGEEPA